MTGAVGWDDKVLRVDGDTPLVRRYRRLQSWYRETQLGVAPGPSNGRVVGSSVPKHTHPALNFLTPEAWQHAEQRMSEVPKEHGTLDGDRLRRNLLSSMPLCFNVFGSLRSLTGFGPLLALLFDAEAATVTDAVCEWAPSKTEHLNDRSAFDAIVRYGTAHGEQRFVGIETKYTEPFSQPEYVNRRYQEVTEQSGWFLPSAFDALRSSPSKQLWRTVMLTARYSATSGAEGRAAVVCLAEDETAVSAVAAVREQMVDPSRLLNVTLEQVADAADGSADPAVVRWASAFRLRYLHPERLDPPSEA